MSNTTSTFETYAFIFTADDGSAQGAGPTREDALASAVQNALGDTHPERLKRIEDRVCKGARYLVGKADERGVLVKHQSGVVLGRVRGLRRRIVSRGDGKARAERRAAARKAVA